MITAVDSNILFDLLIPDPTFDPPSERSLRESSQGGEVVISEPVYAEVAGHFADRRALDEFLVGLGIRRQPSSTAALDLAGRAWREYAAHRPRPIVCPRCGAAQDIRCPQCGTSIQTRQHLVADFIIGAHALVHADRLLTRDRGYYRSYFPQLVLA